MVLVLVTGATGNVGRAVISRCIAAGVSVRALTREPEAARLPREAERVRGDLADVASLATALSGVDALFLFTPPDGSAAAAVARTAGVRRIILLSSAAVERADPGVNPIAARHARAEAAVRDSGIAWTFLRPDSFAANALAWAPAIRDGHPVRAAYADALRNPIHEDDIAAVAFCGFTDDRLTGTTLTLTGPAPITQRAQVETIGETIGRAVMFEELSHQAALEEMTQRMPVAVAERLLDYAARSVTIAPHVTRTVEDVTGRPARTFFQWAADHAEAFR